MVVAVILAGGSGERFGGKEPKQFAKLAGKMVIEHTIDIFERSPDIDQIIVVSRVDLIDKFWDIAKKNNWSKIQKIVAGGIDRFGSTQSAIKSLANYAPETRVLFHDAVRPLLNSEVILRCVDALEDFEAVDVVIPSADTLVAINDNGCISNIPPRDLMRRGQTPQAFRLKTIQEAYERANNKGRRDFTCDCGVVRAMLPNIEVVTVEGAVSNIKITDPLDLFLAEKLIQSNTVNLTTESEHLAMLKNKNLVIFGGNSGIGKSIRDLAVVHGAKVHVASRSNNVDVANLDSVSSYLAQVAQDDQLIDAVINTAGVLIKKPFTSMSVEEIHLLIGTNYTGAVNIAYAAKPYLVKSRGMLLNFTSSSYTRGRAYYALYSSTKCAVVNLTQALAEEWQDEGVRVNCINPERTNTPMRTSNFGEEPHGTLLDPHDVAKVALGAIVSNHTGLVVDVRNQY